VGRSDGYSACDPSGAVVTGLCRFDSCVAPIEMSARYTPGLALLVLAFSLGVTACGDGGGGKESAVSRSRAAARWQRGLLAWHREMLHALDEISLLLSTQESIATLGEPHSKVHGALARFELTLADCAARVERLGPEPTDLPAAQRYALAACASLERGDHLIEAAVRALSKGLAGNIESATNPLSDGQSEMEVATQTLDSASTRASGSG
jgi:hypothetical protein